MTGLWIRYRVLLLLVLWNSQATAKHYTVKQWPARQHTVPRKHNVKNTPLLNPEIVLLPPLHIKLALLKNFVKGLDKSVEGLGKSVEGLDKSVQVWTKVLKVWTKVFKSGQKC